MQNITLPEKIVITVAILIVVLLSSAFYYFFTSFNPVKAQDELTPQALIESVSKIAELPNEQPTIATVTSKEELSQFTFFSQAKLGDKVLIFNEAKKAYLYRPATDKIIEVGPIVITEGAENIEQTANETEISEASVAAVQVESATVTLLNGTKGKGVALKAEKDLNGDQSLNIEVKSKGNTKKDYQKTQVSFTSETAKSQAEKIAQLFNAEVVTLPSGEAKPATDIVVFLGNDRL